MHDRDGDGSVERVSPEAPIPVLRIERERSMLGGAGNVVRNLTALGATARFLSVLGDDAPGREIRALLAAESGVEPYFVVEKNRETAVKTRFVAGTQQLLRADHETVRPLAPASEAALLARLGDVIANTAIVIV